jgi:hypothetical protein
VSPNEVVLGETADIEVIIHNARCVNDHLPFQWDKDGVNIIDSSKYEYKGYSLLVKNLEEADSGNYTITVTSGVKLRKTVSLVVLVKPSMISSLAREYLIHKHNNVSVTCKGTGRPVPEVTWYKNTVKVVEDKAARIQLESMSGGSKLTILSFNESDEGVYQCLIRNKEGDDYGTTYLKAGDDGVAGELAVDGQPSEPTAVNATVSDDKIFVHWRVPFVLSSQIVSYTVYYHQVDGPEKRLVHNKTDVFRVAIPNIVSGVEYHISVSASTSVGESARSSVWKVTIPTNPPSNESSLPTHSSTRNRGNVSVVPGAFDPASITDDFMLIVYIVAPIIGFCVIGLCCFMCRLCCKKKEVVAEQKEETKPGWLPQNDPPKETEVHTPVASVTPMPKPQDDFIQQQNLTSRTHTVSEETDYGTSVDGDVKAAVMPVVPVIAHDPSHQTSTLGRQMPVVAHDSPRQASTLGRQMPVVAHDSPRQASTLGRQMPVVAHDSPRQASTLGRQVPVVAQGSPRQASTLGRQLPAVAHNSPRQASTLGRQVPVVSQGSPHQTSSLGRRVPVVASKPKGGFSFTLPSKSPPVIPAPPPAPPTVQPITYQAAARTATSLPRQAILSHAATHQTPVSAVSEPRLAAASQVPNQASKLVKKNSLKQSSGNQRQLELLPLNTASQQHSQPPKKTVSDQEKKKLDSMIDELVSSPAIAQHNPPRWPDPITSPHRTEAFGPSTVFSEMHHSPTSRYASQRDTGYASPSPPPPPPSAERLPSPPAELLESSPEPQGPPEGINVRSALVER